MPGEPTNVISIRSDGSVVLGANNQIGLGAFSDQLYLGFDGTVSIGNGALVVNAAGDVALPGNIAARTDGSLEVSYVIMKSATKKWRVTVDDNGGLIVEQVNTN